MTHLTSLPRIAREGWVPAGPEKRVNKRAMLIPKTGDPTDDMPKLFDFSEVICPAERRALREIVETAEVVRQNGHVYLTARVSAATLDSLATFETSREDLEDGGDHEIVNEDGDESDLEPSLAAVNPSNRLDHRDQLAWSSGSSSDREGGDDDEREHDFPRERRKYIVDRQQPAREYKWRDPEGHERRFVDPPSYDKVKDQEELRKTKQQVSALVAKKRKTALREDRKETQP